MKNNLIFTVKAIFILFLLGGCGVSELCPDATLEEAQKAIREPNKICSGSILKNDPLIFINRYAEDYCVMPQNMPAHCAPKAAADF